MDEAIMHVEFINGNQNRPIIWSIDIEVEMMMEI